MFHVYSFRYLAFLSTSLLLDEAIGVFRMVPPDGAIPDLKSLHSEPVPAADWEIDTTWQETLAGLPDDFKMLECCVHSTTVECKGDKNLDKVINLVIHYLVQYLIFSFYLPMMSISLKGFKYILWVCFSSGVS